MDEKFSVMEPHDKRPRLYVHTELWPAERIMIQVMLNHLKKLGIEGATGKETVEYEDKMAEMSYVEYTPPEDWTFCDVEQLTQEIADKLEYIFEPQSEKKDAG